MERLETLNIMVTGRCNLNCPCCYQERSLVDIPADHLRNLRDQALPLGLKTVMLSGGEPLLHPDLEEIILLFKEKGATVNLSTNGSAVTKEKAEALLRAGIDTVSVSVDGRWPHRSPDRDAAGAAAARRSIALLQEKGIRVVLNLIVTKETLRRKGETVAGLREMGARNLNLLRPKPGKRPEWYPEARLDERDLYRLQRWKTKLAGRYGFDEVSFDCGLSPLLYGAPLSFLKKEGIRGCGAGIDFLAVTEDGGFYPCPDLKGPDFLLGRLGKEELGRLWLSHPLLLALREKERLWGDCGECGLAEVCRGCRAMAWIERGDLFADDPDCPYRGRTAWIRAAKLAPVYAGVLGAAFRCSRNGNGAAHRRTLEKEALDDPEEVEAYDTLTKVHRTHDDQWITRNVLRLIPADREIHLLDVGCGTARIPLRILRDRPRLRITAVDLSPPMLRRARLNVDSEAPSCAGRIRFLLADGKKLPFPSGAFDFGFCSYSLHHLAKPETMIAEIRRVVRDGGGLFFLDLQRKSGVFAELWTRFFTMTYEEPLRKLYRDSLAAALSFPEFAAAFRSAGVPGIRVRRRFLFDSIAEKEPLGFCSRSAEQRGGIPSDEERPDERAFG